MPLCPALVEVQADQPGDVVGTGVTGDVGRAAFLDDFAVLDDHQPVGEHHGVQWVVRDEDRHRLELRQVAAQLRAYVESGAGVEGGEGFVEEEQAGVGGEGAGEGDALGLAAGETAGSGGEVVLQAHAGQPFRGPGTGLGLRGALAAGAEGDVVQGGEVGEEQVVLEDDADGAVLGGCAGQVGAVEAEVAVGEGGEAGEGAQGRGLAGAVGAEEGEDLAGGGGEGDVQTEAGAGHLEVGVQGGRGGVRVRGWAF